MMASSEQTWDLLLDRLAENASKKPSKTAIAFLSPGPDGGKLEKKLSYGALAEETTELANLLLKKGLAKGDLAVLVYPPSLDFMVAFLACLKAGITAVPVFPPNPVRRDTLNMFSKIVQSCAAKFALTNTDYNHMKKISGIKESLTKFKRTAAAWPEDLTWIVTNTPAASHSKTTSLSKAATTSRSDVAFLQYTSGSTSEPKGVMITHGNLAHNLSIITKELKALDDTVVVSWLPQYHDMGLIGSYLGILYCGGTGYYMSPLSFLQRPMLWIEAVSKYKATHLQAPNFAFKLTARKFQSSSSKSLDLSSVRHAINGAEPVDEDSIESFYKTFGQFGFGKVIYPTYGLAEHTVFVCSGGTQHLSVLKKELEVDGLVKIASDGESAPISKLVGCGYPARQGVDVKIVSTETFEAVAEDAVGEIWIQSPSKAAGYYGMPEATKEDFHAKLKGSNSEDGYLRTGDLGFLHNGELFICGRIKDLIIVGGRNYYPQDIEATAEVSSDLVRPGCSAAFTIDPTHEGGEEVALVMELREAPKSKDVDDVCLPLSNKIRSAVSQEHSLGIAQIIFLEPRTVPKTSSGKIARAWCRKGFLADTLKVVYRKSFKSTSAAFEIDRPNGASGDSKQMSLADAEKIRAMSKDEIRSKLTSDISQIGSIPEESIDKNAALVTMLDSMTISQFKGMLESHYAVKLSDEYLFRESTTLTKLVEVVKLGYAPDDGDGDGQVTTTAATTAANQPGQAKGLAGALGCPPGVVCNIL